MSALKKFIQFATDLEEQEKYFDQMPSNTHTVVGLGIEQEEIKNLWEQTKAAYRESVAEIQDAEKADENQDDYMTVRNTYNSILTAYKRFATKIDEALKLVPQAANSTMFNGQVQNSTPRAEANLWMNYDVPVPPCDTDVFSGKYSDWPSFRDLFTAIFINNNRLSPVQKLYHLCQKTEGEAKEIISKFPLTNDGFQLTWTALTDR